MERDGEHNGNTDKQGYSTRVSLSALFMAPSENLLRPFNPKQQVQCENSRMWPDEALPSEVLPEETQRRSSAGGAPGAWSLGWRAGLAALPMQGARRPCRGDWLRWEANRDSDSAAPRNRERLSSCGQLVLRARLSLSRSVHEIPLYHVRTLELAGMAFWFLPAKELWLEKRRHRLILTLPSAPAAPPRMGSSGPALPFF